MSTAGNTDNDRTGGGNNIKKNFTATTYGNDHGAISFGKIHKRGDVTSDVMLQASDGRHFVSLDKDGQRKGWTTAMCPGNLQLECGSDNTEAQDTCMINAKNGNIDIIATNGKIRLQAHDIELVALKDGSAGNVKIFAGENISLDSKKVLIDGTANVKIMSAGITEVIGNSCLKMYGSIIRGVSDACSLKDSKVGGKRYQQQQSQV